MQPGSMPDPDGFAAPARSAAHRAPVLRSGLAAAAAVALVHAATDAFVAFLPPLLPRIMDKLGLNIALAASLAALLSLATTLPQPVMGSVADRFGRRLLLVAGPATTVVTLSLIGLAPSFSALLVLLALGGLGSAAFHPSGASAAAAVGGGRSGLRVSIFSAGGSAGYAVAPIIAVALVGRVGLEGLWLAMIPGVLVVLLAGALIPAAPPDRPAAPPPAPREILALLRGPIAAIFGISIVFSFAQRVFLTLAPIIVAAAGGSEATGAFALSAYVVGETLGSLAGGYLGDRFDRRYLLLGLTLLAFPAHLGAMWFVTAGDVVAHAFAVSAGFLNMAIVPLIIVMAQEIVPHRTALGSGIVMGLAWAVGSLGVLGAGVLADAIGPRPAALLCMPAILAAALLALHPALDPYRRARQRGAGSSPAAP